MGCSDINQTHSEPSMFGGPSGPPEHLASILTPTATACLGEMATLNTFQGRSGSFGLVPFDLVGLRLASVPLSPPTALVSPTAIGQLHFQPRPFSPQWLAYRLNRHHLLHL